MAKGLKFNPDDIIQLALNNQGYGFKEFVKKLGDGKYEPASKNVSQIMRIFEIHENETGDNIYNLLQDTSNHISVSLPRYLEITGIKYPPPGFGETGGRKPKPKRKGQKKRNVKILLPPQEFNWLNINPNGSRIVVEGRGKTNHWRLIDIKKFQLYYEVEMKTVEQISEIMNISRTWILKLIKRMEIYDQEGVLQEWIDVIDAMYKIESHRGKGHFEDEIMAEFRGIFRNYVDNPLDTERPTVEDIFWVYNQLLAEEE